MGVIRQGVRGYYGSLSQLEVIAKWNMHCIHNNAKAQLPTLSHIQLSLLFTRHVRSTLATLLAQAVLGDAIAAGGAGCTLLHGAVHTSCHTSRYGLDWHRAGSTDSGEAGIDGRGVR